MIELIRTMTKQLTDKLDTMEFPGLKKLVIGDTETKNLGVLCSLCNKFNAKNKASLAAHTKHCKLVYGEKKPNPPPNAILFVPTHPKK